jgi:hypothetical protein
MDPKAKKVVDAAMAWTDTPSVRNAGAIKSAVSGYREALKKEKAIVDARETKVNEEVAADLEETEKDCQDQDVVSSTTVFDTGEGREEEKDYR